MSGQKDQSNGLDRRTFIAASAAGLVLANLPSAARAAAPGAALTAEVRAALPGGLDLEDGWAVEEVTGVEAGALRVVARHAASGRQANIGICAAEPNSRAIASTGRVDLFLMNDGGDGQRRTPDDEVALVRQVARQLAGAEERLAGGQPLLGRQERLAQFDPIDHVDYFRR